MKILAISVFLLILSTPALSQSTRDFLTPEGNVTDFSGVLTETNIISIRNAIDTAYQQNGMDGHVIITLHTDEWHLDEFVKDYADYLQGNGYINSTGWLIYISTEDKKYSIAVQDIASTSFTDSRRDEIILLMNEKLESGDISGAILDGIARISELPTPEGSDQKKIMNPDMLVLAGIFLIIIVLMARLRKNSRKK